MTCENCGQPCDAAAVICPYCRSSARSSVAGAGLARRSGNDSLDRAVGDALLARLDAGAEDLLTRDLAGPLALDELRGAVARIDRGDPSLAELESSLRRDATIALDGIALSELIDARGADAKVVRRGLVFLRTRRWAEAAGWWSLHREVPGAPARRQLLLLLLEAFTHRLAGDPRRAGELQARIAAHPLYPTTRGVTRT